MPPPTPPSVNDGPDDRREADLLHRLEGRGQRLDDPALRHVEADLDHRVVELLAVLGDVDGGDRRADQLHPVPVEDAGVVEGDGEIERRLPADRRQDGVGLLLGDDPLDDVDGERLDVGAVGQLGVGHDRGRIAVDQDHLEPFGAQRLDRLGARVVELAGLADDDRPGADDEDALEVGASGHEG